MQHVAGIPNHRILWQFVGWVVSAYQKFVGKLTFCLFGRWMSAVSASLMQEPGVLESNSCYMQLKNSYWLSCLQRYCMYCTLLYGCIQDCVLVLRSWRVCESHSFTVSMGLSLVIRKKIRLNCRYVKTHLKQIHQRDVAHKYNIHMEVFCLTFSK